MIPLLYSTLGWLSTEKMKASEGRLYESQVVLGRHQARDSTSQNAQITVHRHQGVNKLTFFSRK